MNCETEIAIKHETALNLLKRINNWKMVEAVLVVKHQVIKAR